MHQKQSTHLAPMSTNRSLFELLLSGGSEDIGASDDCMLLVVPKRILEVKEIAGRCRVTGRKADDNIFVLTIKQVMTIVCWYACKNRSITNTQIIG
jgi:hypothetical protein